MFHELEALAGAVDDHARWRPLAVTGSLRLAVLALLLTGGCAAAGHKALVIEDDAQFESAAMRADKPVLVMFFEAGCPPCALLEPTMDQLATEYQGRAIVSKFMILAFLGRVTSPELKIRYEIRLVPHVVLLVNGQERTHWVGYRGIEEYRKGLDEALAQARPPTPAAASRPTG
jgi:thioredoxin 1